MAQQVKDLGCHCWAGVQSLAWEFLRAMGMSKKEIKKRKEKKRNGPASPGTVRIGSLKAGVRLLLREVGLLLT